MVHGDHLRSQAERGASTYVGGGPDYQGERLPDRPNWPGFTCEGRLAERRPNSAVNSAKRASSSEGAPPNPVGMNATDRIRLVRRQRLPGFLAGLGALSSVLLMLSDLYR